jgi:hypothetical protein
MTSQSKPIPHAVGQELAARDLAEYGVARFRDQLFDAVGALWRRRKSEGWTQKQVAEAIGRDPGWVSRNLRAPGNWTTRIAGEFIQGLRGEAEVRITALEDPPDTSPNYDAYDGYISNPAASGIVVNNVTITANVAQIEIGAKATLQANIRSVR